MADFNHKAKNDNILLHLAVIEENLDVVKFLLKHGVPANGRALNKQLSVYFPTDADHQRYVECTLSEINKENNCEDEDKIEATQAKTTTALHLASRNENKDIAEVLLVNGAEINAEMEGGETPLIICILYKCQHVLALLLALGADVNSKTAWGKSALHYAAQTNQKVVAEMLLNAGAQVNAVDLEGLTPLHIAAEAGHKDVVNVLLKNGADVEIRTKSGATVLHYAAVMRHKDVMEMILNHGADINIIMKHGGVDLSPFNWITAAEEKKTWELVARYTNKMSLFNWYNTVFTRLYRKSKERKSIFQADAEQ